MRIQALLVIAVTMATVACDLKRQPRDLARDVEISLEIVATGVTEGFPFELTRLRGTFHAGGPLQTTYVQHYRSPDQENRPMLVVARPYAGLTWTGDPADASQEFIIEPELSGREALLYLEHGIGVTFVYTRFYTDDGIQNDVEDMIAAYEFLRERGYAGRPIATRGASWGGFNALFGAAYVDADLRPRVGAFSYPASDVGRLLAYMRRHPQFEPYADHVAQMEDLFGRSPRPDAFVGYDHAFLAERLTGDFLLFHADSDNAVPFEHSSDLAESSDAFEGVWIDTGRPADLEAPIAHEPASWASTTFETLSALHIISRLSAQETLLIPFEADAFYSFIVHTRLRQLQGADIGWLGPRLADFMQPGVYLLSATDGEIIAGDDFVARLLDTFWGDR